MCVLADEFPQEVFDVLQDGLKITSHLQDDEVKGIQWVYLIHIQLRINVINLTY